MPNNDNIETSTRKTIDFTLRTNNKDTNIDLHKIQETSLPVSSNIQKEKGRE